MNKIKEQKLFKVGYNTIYTNYVDYILVSADSLFEAHDIAKDYLNLKIPQHKDIVSIQQESTFFTKNNN